MSAASHKIPDPSWYRHSDILKMILVHCQGLTFTMYYLHIKDHQNDNVSFKKLSRKAQLNCKCDHAAKQRIATDGTDGAKSSGMFPLEPVGLFIGDEKTTSDTGDQIRFWALRQFAKKFFNNCKILLHSQFESIDWIFIHQTLHDLPRLFQIWAAKQVLGIAGTTNFWRIKTAETHYARAARSVTRHVNMSHNALKLGMLPHLHSPLRGWNNG
jgi:hypothetical protein